MQPGGPCCNIHWKMLAPSFIKFNVEEWQISDMAATTIRFLSASSSISLILLPLACLMGKSVLAVYEALPVPGTAFYGETFFLKKKKICRFYVLVLYIN